MALTVAQILRLRAAGAVRVSCRGDDVDVEFTTGTVSPWTHGVKRTIPTSNGDRDTAEVDEKQPRPRDALETAQDFNGPIPPVLDD